MKQRKLSQLLVFIFLTCLFLFCTGCTPKLNIDIPAHAPPPIIPSQQPRVALVLGGGGARGYAHVGVIKVLQQAGIPIDLIVGTSAGGIVGALYADHPNAAALQEKMMNATIWNFVDISPLNALQGIITGAQLQQFILQNTHSRTFAQMPIKFIAVATDLKTGAPVLLESGPLAPAVNASAAIPPIVKPVSLYGHLLIDGGTVAPVPVAAARKYNPKMIIAVNIDQLLPKQMPTNIIQVTERADAIAWLQLTRFSTAGADILLHPNVAEYGFFDVTDKKNLIAAGERAARRALPQIRQLLIKKGIINPDQQTAAQ